ncbi:hypothetical protein MS2017_1903 [Bathymodiolus thermophilus thioautotrophic gill symbiont]|uniref:Uncharacterized protein n=1 Tax=Bathymodiolus thermophilus thioautotrophic gill symbiont TaxID=2360 RepID=A0A3G3IPA1_9GAMM|nr:hypothetical protein MS2017_1903 [Bathymodiolus thermophilus thioautotrophic gill symbiont]
MAGYLKLLYGEKFSFNNWKSFIPERYSDGEEIAEWVINLPPKPKVKQDSDKICLETLSRKRWPRPRGHYPFSRIDGGRRLKGYYPFSRIDGE